MLASRWNPRWLVRAGLFVLLQSGACAAFGLSMAFVNPGKSTEPYWVLATDMMQHAADSLDIELEILTTERDYLAQIRFIEALAQRPASERPDYLIVAAEKSTLKGQLDAAQRTGIPVFLAFNSAFGSDKQVGAPRQRYRHWLGSLSPIAEEGGYHAARALITHAVDSLPAGTPLGMIVLAGDRSTHTSRERNKGLARALAEFPQVKLHQQVHADWSYNKALEQSTHLLRRYPNVPLIWSANELQAFGAIQALHEMGREPGKDVFVSAINATQAALESLLSGDLAALAGGHHMAGAWSMVLLYDYHHGVDFMDAQGNAELEYSMFSLIDQRSATAILKRRHDRQTMDFCRYSRVCNPAREEYDFTYQRWFEDQ